MSVLLHAPSSRSRGGQPRHVRPARAPRDRALLLRLPGAERATGVLPQLANRGVRRGVQLQRPPHHRAVRDGDDDALPNAATGCEAQAMEEHAAEDIKHIPLTTVRLPAARSLPLGLAAHVQPAGPATRTGSESPPPPRCAECGQRVAAEFMQMHRDQHMAERLQREWRRQDGGQADNTGSGTARGRGQVNNKRGPPQARIVNFFQVQPRKKLRE